MSLIFFRSIYYLNKGLSGILGHFQKNIAFFCLVKTSECNAMIFSKLKTQIVSWNEGERCCQSQVSSAGGGESALLSRAWEGGLPAPFRGVSPRRPHSALTVHAISCTPGGCHRLQSLFSPTFPFPKDAAGDESGLRWVQRSGPGPAPGAAGVMLRCRGCSISADLGLSCTWSSSTKWPTSVSEILFKYVGWWKSSN